MDPLKGEWRNKWKDKEITAENAINKIIPGNRVFIGSGCSEPQLLTSELIKQSEKLIDTEILHFLTIGPEKYFLSAISPRPKATPELVKQGILVSAQCGADALTIGHYDGAWPDCLRAIREGIEEAGIIIDRDVPVCGG